MYLGHLGDATASDDGIYFLIRDLLKLFTAEFSEKFVVDFFSGNAAVLSKLTATESDSFEKKKVLLPDVIFDVYRYGFSDDSDLDDSDGNLVKDEKTFELFARYMLRCASDSNRSGIQW